MHSSQLNIDYHTMQHGPSWWREFKPPNERSASHKPSWLHVTIMLSDNLVSKDFSNMEILSIISKQFAAMCACLFVATTQEGLSELKLVEIPA